MSESGGDFRGLNSCREEACASVSHVSPVSTRAGHAVMAGRADSIFELTQVTGVWLAREREIKTDKREEGGVGDTHI